MRSSLQIQMNERDQKDLELTGIEERDGIFYKFVSENDRYKYKLLNDNELRDEERRCEEIAKNILDTEKRKKSSALSATKSRERPLSASRAIFAKTTPLPTNNTKNDSQTKKPKDDNYTGTPSRTQPISTTIKKAAKKREQALDKSLEDDATLQSQTSLSAEQILQIKYQKNLEVIEKLYLEKQEAELKAKRLERDLQRFSKSWKPPSPNPSNRYDRTYDELKQNQKKKPLKNNFLSTTATTNISVGASVDNVLYGTLTKQKPGLGHLIEEEDSETDSHPITNGGGDEAINIDDSGRQGEGGGEGSVAPPQSSDEPNWTQHARAQGDHSPQSTTTTTPTRTRRISGVEAASMNFNTAPATAASRSTSVRPSSASSALRRSSYHIDRGQANELHQGKKELAAKELVQYELEKKKRMERALRGSFSESLQKSHEDARQKVREKQEKRKLEEERARLLQEKEDELRKKRLKEIYERSLKDDDLRDLKAKEDRRKEDKLKHKEELLMTASLPNSATIAAHIDKLKENEYTKQKREAIDGRKKRDEELKKRREESQRRREWALQGSQSQSQTGALDPEEVTERLARQHAIWDATLAEQKQKLLAETKKRTATPPPTALQSMERRRERMDQKKSEALAARKKKEEEEEWRKKEEERLRLERLMALPIPPAGINNTARLRAERAQQLMEKQRKEEEKVEARRREVLKREKETAKMTMFEMAQHDAERREKVGNSYVQLFNIDQVAAKKAQITKKESEERQKANQEKIQEKLSTRPSLITRQAQEQQAQAAKMAALTKVANATRAAVGAGKGDLLDDALFTHEERAKKAFRVLLGPYLKRKHDKNLRKMG